ncbi:Propeptide PepSY amd peptidase M4 [Nitrosococcus halophilus Nc 4]|uniref:Propeptide PepSY amd peptidase M4 n=1 Tax=Nitrosococcus halophilus (strain Nc4) TaxID=472759 RepID=D5BWT8_NITHN|nr:PepSY domain-containing protein [Nitrosococcus halophilus]ADE13819.1 Propeptide PepSY amd peptidase M4 [Nitrosococcus halophilus Nc 4]
MMKGKKLIPLAVFVGLTTLGAGQSYGQQSTPAAEGFLAIEQIIEKVRADYPGEIIAVEREKEEGKMVWEVEVKDKDGKKWEVYYDASTGKKLKSEPES